MTRIRAMIALSIVLSTLASTLILPILAPLIRTLGLSATQGGLMMSIGSVVMMLLAPFWGRLSDRRGRKVLIVVGFAGILAGYALFALAVWAGLWGGLAAGATLLFLVLARAVMGGFLSAVPAGAQALMADITTPDTRAAGMAVIGGATGLGMIVGPALSGLLVQFGLLWPLVMAIALCGIGLIAAIAFLDKGHPRAGTEIRRTGLFAPELRHWLMAGIATWSGIAATQISAGFYFQDRLGLTPGEVAGALSVALTLVGTMMVAVQIAQVRYLHLAPTRLVILGALAWVAACVVLLVTVSVPTYWGAFVLLGIGAGLLLPGIMSGASLAAGAESQGAAAGLVGASQGIGFIIGPLVSTMLYDLNPFLPFGTLGAVMLILNLTFWMNRSHEGETSA